MRMRWLAGFAIISACAAQEGPYRVGNGVSPPVPIQKSEPGYTEEARLAGVDGSVRVSLVVDTEGNPTDLKSHASDWIWVGRGGCRDRRVVEIQAGDEGWERGSGADFDRGEFRSSGQRHAAHAELRV